MDVYVFMGCMYVYLVKSLGDILFWIVLIRIDVK